MLQNLLCCVHCQSSFLKSHTDIFLPANLEFKKKQTKNLRGQQLDESRFLKLLVGNYWAKFPFPYRTHAETVVTRVVFKFLANLR